MANRLRDSLSSDYFNAANQLKSKSAKKRIVAYVEAYDDVFFWRTILSEYETEDRFFEVMLPSKNNLTKGKKSVLMSFLAANTGQSMIACVDADYDYLLQGATPMSVMVTRNPFVFHTYAYAIENLQCYAPSLHDVAVAVTLNDNPIFDACAFLSAYSKIVYPLFLWNVWLYKIGKHELFPISAFNTTVSLHVKSIDTVSRDLHKLNSRVHQKIKALEKEHALYINKVKSLGDELIAFGVSRETTYLYIQGHHLFDTIIVPMMEKVCERLIKEREEEINQKAIHDTQRNNELACYGHSIEEVQSMLKRNVGFKRSKLYKKICSDIELFLERKV